MKKLIGLLVAVCMTAPLVHAETAAHAPAKKTVKKASPKHKAAKVAEEKPDVLLDEDGKEFNAGTASVTDVNCELGNKLTLYRNTGDNEHMALRWNRRVHQMTRVSTSTGANRFENSKFGLVWIGIPAKGMLLDAKKGQQLANECKDADQMAMKPVVLEPTRPANLPAPIAAPKADPKADLKSEAKEKS